MQVQGVTDKVSYLDLTLTIDRPTKESDRLRTGDVVPPATCGGGESEAWWLVVVRGAAVRSHREPWKEEHEHGNTVHFSNK